MAAAKDFGDEDYTSDGRPPLSGSAGPADKREAAVAAPSCRCCCRRGLARACPREGILRCERFNTRHGTRRLCALGCACVFCECAMGHASDERAVRFAVTQAWPRECEGCGRFGSRSGRACCNSAERRAVRLTRARTFVRAAFLLLLPAAVVVTPPRTVTAASVKGQQARRRRVNRDRTAPKHPESVRLGDQCVVESSEIARPPLGAHTLSLKAVCSLILFHVRSLARYIGPVSDVACPKGSASKSREFNYRVYLRTTTTPYP
ncbi:hypothetical protein HPB50_012630 [Hyalomma asiaticum]|uniref:Uncharacterized protein n=1 Tax=Hyalomma asiaticum TaxID=266040 RepID=A0ACB7S6H1_HYAAI|nr:hypothetical protein HPB50_012630 [Hyalomma asiaticum]